MTESAVLTLSELALRHRSEGERFEWRSPVLVKRPDGRESVTESRSFHTRGAASVALAEEALRRAANRPSQITGLRYGRVEGEDRDLETDDVLVLEKRPGATTFPDRIGIGRAPNVDVCVPLARVSKYHAFVTVEGDDVWLSDARSTFGTFVDGQRLEPLAPLVLSDGARISLGPYTFRFHTAEGLRKLIARLAAGA